MNRQLGLVLFISFFVFVDYYLFQSYKVLLKSFEPGTQKILKVAYWSLPVLAIIIIVGSITIFPVYLPQKFRNLMGAGVFVVYISKFIAFVFVFIADVMAYCAHLGKKVISPETNEHKFTRSEFIAKSAMAVGGTHIGLMAYGILSGAHDYKIRQVKLAIKGLPKAFHGLKLAQLSDIHSGSFFNKTAVQGGVDMLNAHKPDLFFFTGDLVNNEAKEFKEYFDIFKQVKAPLGRFSTLGNHDYGDYIPWDSEMAKNKNLLSLIEAHKLMGWDILMDQNRTISMGVEHLGVIGIQNWGLGGFVKKGDLKKALQNTDHMSTKLLLSHDPSHWRAEVLKQTDIDVAFAGHTHGMQYGVEIGDFKWSPVQYRYKEWAGLYTEGDQKLYVNRGFGYLGFPGRVGILPEISIFTLEAV
jgi:uncharacterized protein